MSPKIFLWHQGEKDARLNDVSIEKLIKIPYFGKYFHNKEKWILGLEEDIYYNALNKITEKTLRMFPKSSFGIALATRCSNKDPWQPVRNAQAKVAKSFSNAFISADSDRITGLKNRPDNCHFSLEGASLLGKQYYESITQELEKKEILKSLK